MVEKEPLCPLSSEGEAGRNEGVPVVDWAAEEAGAGFLREDLRPTAFALDVIRSFPINPVFPVSDKRALVADPP